MTDIDKIRAELATLDRRSYYRLTHQEATALCDEVEKLRAALAQCYWAENLMDVDRIAGAVLAQPQETH